MLNFPNTFVLSSFQRLVLPVCGGKGLLQFPFQRFPLARIFHLWCTRRSGDVWIFPHLQLPLLHVALGSMTFFLQPTDLYILRTIAVQPLTSIDSRVPKSTRGSLNSFTRYYMVWCLYIIIKTVKHRQKLPVSWDLCRDWPMWEVAACYWNGL